MGELRGRCGGDVTASELVVFGTTVAVRQVSQAGTYVTFFWVDDFRRVCSSRPLAWWFPAVSPMTLFTGTDQTARGFHEQSRRPRRLGEPWFTVNRAQRWHCFRQPSNIRLGNAARMHQVVSIGLQTNFGTAGIVERGAVEQVVPRSRSVIGGERGRHMVVVAW